MMQSENKRSTILFTFRLLIGLAVALVCTGCSEDESVVRVDLNNSVEVTLAQPDQAVTYAYLPQYSHSVSYERHWRLVERLMAATGLHIRQVFPSTFDAHIKMVERGEIDISFSNPFIYIKLAETGAEAFARIIESTGKPDFMGQVICRRDNERIKDIEDCRGKRWIAVDPSSAGGYLFALGHFIEQGVNRQDFSEIAFASGPGGKQEKVVLAVYAGQYDIGSIRNGTLNILKDRIDLSQVRILAETRPYPGWVYAARKGLDPEIVDKIAQAMFTLSMEDEKDAVILETAGMRGIIPATDTDYDLVRDLADRLQMR
ncbi:MAG: phosphate/phosphite/phosphonate ABC transporter substrate-binding protein [Thermodesulfobacteriota bacterium]|nr:phosphate/phosphite/phosphonate ABC transporter substrate-binding protein [Thermodesulfobacteriota bacterium]